MQKTVTIELSKHQYQDLTRALLSADYSELKEDDMFSVLMRETMQRISRKVFEQIVDDKHELILTKGEASVLESILKRLFKEGNYPLLGGIFIELGQQI